MELEGKYCVLNEDVAFVILEHLADKCFVSDPRVHWTNLATLNRVFNRAVHRLLSRTCKIALEEEYDNVRVILFCDVGSDKFDTSTTWGSSLDSLISSISFERKEQAAAFLRFLASNARRSVIVDLEDYYDHPDDDPAVGALSNFPRIGTISFRRPQCRCRACCALVEHCGPQVKIIEIENESVSGHESSDSYNVPTGVLDSDGDDYDDLYFSDLRDVDDY